MQFDAIYFLIHYFLIPGDTWVLLVCETRRELDTENLCWRMLSEAAINHYGIEKRGLS